MTLFSKNIMVIGDEGPADGSKCLLQEVLREGEQLGHCQVHKIILYDP